jgi:hypothetical protein
VGRVAHQSPTVEDRTYTASKAWAPGGYLQSIGYQDGDTVGPTGYDEAGRVMSVAGIVNTVSYDASGRPRQKVNANATTTTWTYAPTRGVLERISTLMGSTPIQNLGYTIDDAGLVRVVTSPAAGEGWKYEYDELNHVQMAENTSNPGDTQTFDYDAGDRIKSNSRVGTYTYPLPGQPRPHAPAYVSGSLRTYDDNGNLEVGGGRAPVWNADNLIDEVGSTQFAYDGLGERVKKTDGSTTSLYPFGEVTGGPNPGTFWIHTDRLGSTLARIRSGWRADCTNMRTDWATRSMEQTAAAWRCRGSAQRPRPMAQAAAPTRVAGTLWSGSKDKDKGKNDDKKKTDFRKRVCQNYLAREGPRHSS